ncbi:type I restriction-modification system restriction enzyme [Helicobacter mustelae]|uniref:type I restriction endonuclease subunit R n=1 Tax=Helicobacter mustelae TaxID=217 RepID=UPI000E0672DD|nr:type I restriction endonuclease subunit R [Helicobacter mustelae]STP12712.1 type I restriction-modification system restriction enzyme [Helicobacter mustelae]
MNYQTIAQSNESTVVAEYFRETERKGSYESEAELEREFIAILEKQGYEYKKIHNQEKLKQNLRESLERLNEFTFSDSEWKDFYTHIIANKQETHKEKTKKFQQVSSFTLDLENGEKKNIKLIDKKNIYRNSLQVIHQYEANGGQNRYDVSILVNGLPLVHVELKKRGVALKNAFTQMQGYAKKSFCVDDGLFDYVQIFVISNGTESKYYSNTIKSSRNGKNTDTFEFTNYWADAKNQKILDLVDFAKTFFARHSILNILTRYCIFTSDENLLVMRPYQIVATERILEKIRIVHQNKSYGTKGNGGYIWHTTGSGKTLTSFRAATLTQELKHIAKVLFVVDRKDLDYQTMKEYENFQKGAANATKNTTKLKEHLENPDAKIIVTTIQKLAIFIEKNPKHEIYQKEVVIIFDECHRSLGNVYKQITQAFKKYYFFGFTGTPIFAENCDKSKPQDTTENKFGERLHEYTIIDAISDKNVLPFRVEYTNTTQAKKDIEDKEIRAIDEEKALLDERRIKAITDYIIKNFARLTKNEENYAYAKNLAGESTQNKSGHKGFNSILACSSIKAAKKYYQAFKEQDHSLKIATIFSYSQSEGIDGLEEENNENIDGLDQNSKEFLDNAIKDYNAMFGSNFDTSGFQEYYKDLAKNMKERKIDILIVANMFLTGFDAKTLNTLWVDKNLKYHGLIQAFSRTNRILDSVKTHGNIVCFRNLEQDLNDALKLFGNKNASAIVLLRKYEDYLNGYVDDEGKIYEGYKSLIEKLKGFPLGTSIDLEEEKREFIKLFGSILKLENLLNSFEEFQKSDHITERDFQDYQGMYLNLHDEMKEKREKGEQKEEINGELVFEVELVKQEEVGIDYILNLIYSYKHSELTAPGIREIIDSIINSSTQLRSRKELIEGFVKKYQSNPNFKWQEHVKQQREEEFQNIIKANNLQEKKAYAFMSKAFKSGEISFLGTEFPDILPKMSFFQDGRKEVKAKVEQDLQEFFDKFYEIYKSDFTKQESAKDTAAEV